MRWLLLALVAVFPAACSGGPAIPELYLYIWADYLPDQTIRTFEAEHKCKVTVANFESSDDLKNKLVGGAGGYDVVWPSDDLMPMLVSAGVLDAVDGAKVPNIKNLAERFRGDLKHGVPYAWGTTGIAYNTEKIKDKIDSWAALFDTKYQRISMLEDPREVFAAALRLDGKNGNTTEQGAIDKAKERLIRQKSHLGPYNSQPREMLQSGELWLVQCFSGDALQAAADAPIAYVIPKEGATLWVDFMSIPKSAKNKDLAHKFIDFVLRPTIGAEIALYRHYPTPNEAAMKEKSMEALVKNPMVYPSEEDLKRCERFTDLGAARQAIEKAWAEVTAK